MTITVYPPYGSGPNNPVNIAFPPTALDAFGRLQVSEPYTLFDSQNRYATDNQFDTALTGTGTTSFLTNEAAVNMEVTSGGVGSVVRQSYRSLSYQPGKGLLVLATFVMSSSTSANLTQRAGYFNSENGVFFQKVGSTLSFVLRSFVTGVASDARTVNQSSWNGDKLDGTGPSGITLDVSKAQILWMDFEWLGAGSVRCGFAINGIFYLCHTFNNANIISNVYMTTAILPVRYEITSVTAAVAASMKQICSTVISEGGYEQTSVEHTARMINLTATSYLTTTFKPLVSIRLASTALGAVVIPFNINFLPSTADNFEVALIKNGTLATTPSWAAVDTDPNVQYDIGSTSITGGSLVYSEYATGKTGRTILSTGSGYNWDLQIGASLAGVSDIFTVVARCVTTGGSGTGGGIASISFYDLTQ
jgi:hypothetical protein